MYYIIDVLYYWCIITLFAGSSLVADDPREQPDVTNPACNYTTSELLVAAAKALNDNSLNRPVAPITSQTSQTTTQSTKDFIRQIFSSDSLLQNLCNGSKAPCSSNASVHTAKSTDSLDSLRIAMRRLFSANADELTNVIPGATRESTESLALAMQNLFMEASQNGDSSRDVNVGLNTSNESLAEALRELFKQTQRKPRLSTSNDSLCQALRLLFRKDVKPTLTTSNESLAQAMHWLFTKMSDGKKPSSQTSLSSAESMILWNLLDSAPKGVKLSKTCKKNRAKKMAHAAKVAAAIGKMENEQKSSPNNKDLSNVESWLSKSPIPAVITNPKNKAATDCSDHHDISESSEISEASVVSTATDVTTERNSCGRRSRKKPRNSGKFIRKTHRK